MPNNSQVPTTLSSLKQIGAVELNVQNIQKLTTFYRDIIGLEIIKQVPTSTTLGKNNIPILVLHKNEELQKANSTQAGLYHFAILFSSQGDLARTIHKILTRAPHFFTGSSDHLVSEAFYLNDPEGNGIELYFDRDRSLWKWENNQVKMASIYIDPTDYINRYIVLEEKDTKTTVGHIHLKVGDIKKAKDFYVTILGFGITAELPGALFVSVGGYHHHIGMNTWESYGAEQRKDSLGLKQFTFVISDKEDFEQLKNRLKKNHVPFTENKHFLEFYDPWKNHISFTVSN